MGKKLFADRPEVQERYERKMQEQAAKVAIPEEVPVRPSVAHRIAKNHRIRTDTGIEFTTLPDGHISITIKGVGSIENR